MSEIDRQNTHVTISTTTPAERVSISLEPEEVRQILSDWAYRQLGEGRGLLRCSVDDRQYQGDYIGHEVDLFLEVNDDEST